MNCFIYLILMNIKNRLLEIKRKPVKMVLYIIVLAAFLFAIIFSMLGDVFSAETEAGEISESGELIEPKTYTDIIWLKGAVFGIVLLFSGLIIPTAFKNGSAIFEMNDVNFLFVSPVKPQSVLLYGVMRMVWTSFIMGIFVIYQGAVLNSVFGIPVSSVIPLSICLILGVCFSQILTLLIYSLTNSSAKRKNIAKALLAAIFIPMLAVGVSEFMRNDGNLIVSLEALLRSPVTAFTPVAGWTAHGTVALISGDILIGFLFVGLTVAAGAGLLIYLYVSKTDFYEDALVATETVFEKKRALLEGNIQSLDATDKKTKVARTGIDGAGASVFFYKHLRESFRSKKFGLWGLGSFVLIAGAALPGIINIAIGEPESNNGIYMIILLSLMWIQTMMVGVGRGLKELYSHYIYMVPETSLNKIIWSNIEAVFKVFVESVFIFGISGAVMGENPPVIIGAILAYSLFTLLLIAVNYFYMRFTESKVNSGVLLMIYYATILAVMLPGAIPAFIIGSIDGMLFVGLLVLAGWELIAAVGCFWLSKSILHKCDMPVIKLKE